MAMAKDHREYDIVLVGATGYTGMLTAESIVRQLPANLRWAVAGRSQTKLESLAQRLKDLQPDRVQPVVETFSLTDDTEFNRVLSRTKVCISLVSYHHAGEEVVDACVRNGTDYIDASGDVLLLHRWIEKYHEKAAAAGIALIFGAGIFSAPQDLLTWAVNQELRSHGFLETEEAILSVLHLTISPSGGTVESIRRGSKTDSAAAQQLQQPWILSPVQGSQILKQTNWLGLRYNDDLGWLADSQFGATQDRAIIHRTWGLLDGGKTYGPNFKYSEYDSASSTIAGVLKVLRSKLMSAVLSFRPTLALVGLFLPQPGDGPDLEKSKVDQVDLKILAVPRAGSEEHSQKRGHARFIHHGGNYFATATLLAQGAASLLYQRALQGGIHGGCLTPAILGDDYIERLRRVGVVIQTSVS